MKYKNELIWSILFFILTLLWKLFEKVMGWHSSEIERHATYSTIYDFIFIAIFALAIWHKRKQVIPAGFSWLEGFRFGMKLTFLFTLISPIIQTITHRFISPEFFPNIVDLAVSHNLLTREAAKAKFNLTNYIVENAIGTFILGFISSLLLPSIFKKNEVTSNKE